jgi:hypothetical protein
MEEASVLEVSENTQAGHGLEGKENAEIRLVVDHDDFVGDIGRVLEDRSKAADRVLGLVVDGNYDADHRLPDHREAQPEADDKVAVRLNALELVGKPRWHGLFRIEKQAPNGA